MKEKLLYTGASGFLGQNTLPLLKHNYDVTTIGIGDNDDIKSNFASEIPILDKKYDVVLHAAGKAHFYPKSPDEIKSFYDVNFEGTKNLCRGLERVGLPKSFIFISTLDVYGLSEGVGIDESYPTNPQSHYSKSKLMAEGFLTDWAQSNNVTLGILRPSLMVGPNPPGNLRAMILGIKKGFYVNISGGLTRKSLLMVYDIANIVPKIEDVGGTYNLCDNHHPSYSELSLIIKKQLGIKRPLLSIPYWCANILAKIGDLTGKLPIDSHRLMQLTRSNTYSNSKVKKMLGWEPLDVIENFKIENI